MKHSYHQLKRFIFSGISTVIIDITIYTILINLGVNLSFSKAIAFSSGTIYSYFINKKWTFNAMGSFKIFLKFILVYIISLNINILVNKLMIDFFIVKNFKSVSIAFLISTFFSATFNFLFLKKFVFKDKKLT